MEFYNIEPGKTFYSPLTNTLIRCSYNPYGIKVNITTVTKEDDINFFNSIVNGSRKIELSPEDLKFLETYSSQRKNLKDIIEDLKNEDSELSHRVSGILFPKNNLLPKPL